MIKGTVGVRLIKYLLLLVLLTICNPFSSKAYSLLTHEAIIDASWKKAIEPLLLQRYPNTTEAELIEAHSYAYGGAIMPDIGYSPFGSMLYTDFVHNVRSGDYVEALLQEAESLNEFAFALGSLAHYMGDIYGHSLATNVAVPLIYPKTKVKYGNVVTYADDNISHSRMELAFDVLQTARGNYATKSYHDFIGFNVARRVVEKAFFRTYGMDVNDVFGSMTVAISTFRWTIKTLLPTIVRSAWATKKAELRKLNSGATLKRFSYKMKNRTYYHKYGKDHQRAGFFPTIFSVIVPILPKIGPLAKLRYKVPTPEAEKLFIKSFDTTLVQYDLALKKLQSEPLHLPNRSLDTGLETVQGGYAITDINYSQFLLKLSETKFENVSAEIKSNIISFYSSDYSKTKPSNTNKKALKKRMQITTALNALNGIN